MTLDALCGRGGHPEIGPMTKGISEKDGRNNPKAVVSFGESRSVPGMSYAGLEQRRKVLVYGH